MKIPEFDDNRKHNKVTGDSGLFPESPQTKMADHDPDTLKGDIIRP